jgi:hypothetical protein
MGAYKDAIERAEYNRLRAYDIADGIEEEAIHPIFKRVRKAEKKLWKAFDRTATEIYAKTDAAYAEADAVFAAAFDAAQEAKDNDR